MTDFLISLAIPIALILALMLFIGLTLSRLWRRATREVSLVRTGAGGKLVVMDGGCIVLPMFHEISHVNMKMLRLEVKRNGDGALITKDRMRVDVGVEFYVSVNATDEGVARAAQTLGDRTFDVDALREMIEGKLVDGLRSVAARMTMDELHENRADFVQDVKNTVVEDLTKNGLELESVSLTALDQTPFNALDENNAFNAVGMRRLAEVIATSKKERAQIDADAEVAVRLAAMEAAKRRLEIDRDEEQAKIAQHQDLETLRAAQEAEIARRREAAAREADQARIEREQAVRASEIAKERAVREAEIQRDKELQAAEIARAREIEVADQDKAIVVAQKSEEESRARASADEARALAAKAQEAIETAHRVAEADRAKAIALIDAAREAEREATRIRLAAQAEKDAAADRAEAVREEARADADAIRIRAEAKREDMAAEAEGQRALIDAENALGDALIAMKLRIAEIEAAPKLAAELVKPAEKIDSIRINHIGGLAGGASQGAETGAAKPAVNQALDSILGMALQMPTMRKIGEELGLSLEDGYRGVSATPDVAEIGTESGEVLESLGSDGKKTNGHA